MPTNAIIEAFDAAGVDYEDILSTQRRLSSNTWDVAFRTAIAKEQVLSAWNFVIAGHHVVIADCDRKISLVKVYNAPNEMSDSVRCFLLGEIFLLILFLTEFALPAWKLRNIFHVQ